jgi:hypothetical protein
MHLDFPSRCAKWEGSLSSAPQLRRLVEPTRNNFDPGIDVYPGSATSVAVTRPTILLVGRTGAWGASILQPLEKLGCDLLLVSPEDMTTVMSRENEHEIILLDSTVSPEQRRMLVTELIGTAATIFYTFPVENGCWWVPTLVHGQDCHGAPAFRGKDFPQELERILSLRDVAY